jgi:hypothetical protein
MLVTAEPNSEPPKRYLLRLASSVMTGLVFAPCVMSTVTIAIYEVFLGLLSFQSLLKTFRRQAVWGSPRMFIKLRELQVLLRVFNLTYQRYFFAQVLGMAMWLTIIAGTCVLKMHDQISYIQSSGLFVITLTGYVAIGFIWKLASQVWVVSEGLNLDLKTNVSRQRLNLKLRRAQVASLVPLKVKVGSVNFVDRLTPAVMMASCVQQTISLLML